MRMVIGLGSVTLALLGTVACGGDDSFNIQPPATDSGGGPDTLTTDGGGNPDAIGNDSSNIPDSSVTCPQPQIACNNKCIDPTTDNANCGGCGSVCNTQCVSGTCPLFGADAGAPQNVGDFACVAVDSTNVYWATGQPSNMGGSVWSVPVNGGAPKQVIGAQDRPHAIASDGTFVYFGNYGTFNGSNGTIQKVPIAGGNAIQLAAAQNAPMDIAIDATNVYWTNAFDGTIWTVDKAANTAPKKIGGGGGNFHATKLRVDASNVYYTDSAGNVVNRLLKNGQGNAQPVMNVPSPGAVAIDGTNVYTMSNKNGVTTIFNSLLTANNANGTQLVTNLSFSLGLETDGTNLWWSQTTKTGTINRSTIAGSNQATLASNQNFPGCLAVDATSVYWINLGGGMVVKTGK